MEIPKETVREMYDKLADSLGLRSDEERFQRVYRILEIARELDEVLSSHKRVLPILAAGFAEAYEDHACLDELSTLIDLNFAREIRKLEVDQENQEKLKERLEALSTFVTEINKAGGLQ